jgi:hypothetical protein
MRRLLVLLSSLATTAVAVLGVSSAGATPRAGDHQMIVCPAGSAEVGPPCCGPPANAPDATLPGCCTDLLPSCCPVAAARRADAVVACCPSGTAPCGVSIAVSPNPATSGQKVTVSGKLSGGTPSGVTVQLFQELAGATKFTQVAQATTGSDGSYSIVAPGKVQTDRTWYVTAPGNLQSATISEQVAANVTLLVARARHSATVHGSVTPSHAGQPVMVQRRVRGKWVTIARPQLNDRSKFSVRYGHTPRVKATLRAVLAADSNNMRSVSSTVTAVVFPSATSG